MIGNDARLAHFENKLNARYEDSCIMKIKEEYGICKLHHNIPNLDP